MVVINKLDKTTLDSIISATDIIVSKLEEDYETKIYNEIENSKLNNEIKEKLKEELRNTFLHLTSLDMFSIAFPSIIDVGGSELYDIFGTTLDEIEDFKTKYRNSALMSIMKVYKTYRTTLSNIRILNENADRINRLYEKLKDLDCLVRKYELGIDLSLPEEFIIMLGVYIDEENFKDKLNRILSYVEHKVDETLKYLNEAETYINRAERYISELARKFDNLDF